MAAVRSGSLCVSSVNLVSISACLLYLGSFFSQRLLAHNLWTPAERETRALPAMRSSAPGYARHTQHAIPLRHLHPSHLWPWKVWLKLNCLKCWKRGKLLGARKTEAFHTKNNIDSQTALDIYKIWELFPAVFLREKHKYPPFLHTFSNCHGRRPHYGPASLTQPTPAMFSCSPAQGPQSHVHGTEHCPNTRRYQDHF